MKKISLILSKVLGACCLALPLSMAHASHHPTYPMDFNNHQAQVLHALNPDKPLHKGGLELHCTYQPRQDYTGCLSQPSNHDVLVEVEVLKGSGTLSCQSPSCAGLPEPTLATLNQTLTKHSGVQQTVLPGNLGPIDFNLNTEAWDKIKFTLTLTDTVDHGLSLQPITPQGEDHCGQKVATISCSFH